MRTQLPNLVDEAWRADAAGAQLSLRAVDESDFAEIAAILALAEGYTTPADAPYDAAEVKAEIDRRAAGGWLLGLAACETTTRTLVAFLLYLTRDKLRETFPEGDILARLPNGEFPSDGRFLQVYDLWVSPACRRRGLGAALKRAMEAHARALDFACLLTFTEATNAHVLRLNAQLGYRAIYEGPMWDAVPRVALIKRLD